MVQCMGLAAPEFWDTALQLPCGGSSSRGKLVSKEMSVIQELANKECNPKCILENKLMSKGRIKWYKF